MSDLVERLREYFSGGIGYEAADRITELEARLEASQEALAEILVLNKANQDRAETAEATLAKYLIARSWP